MTRRERLERKLELRQEWAAKAEKRSVQRFDTADKMASVIPFGQPILVGHYSEKSDRAYRNRIHNNMRKGCEEEKLATYHESKVSGIEHALDRSIFSDDDNAIDALEQRIAENETKREQMKLVNKLYRKGDAIRLAELGINLDTLKAKLLAAGPYFGQSPHMPYELSNLGGRITADRKRLDVVKEQAKRRATAEVSDTGVVVEDCSNGYCRVTFAEKPEREVINSLKAAGFWWGRGCWSGKLENIPQSVKEMAHGRTEEATTETTA